MRKTYYHYLVFGTLASLSMASAQEPAWNQKMRDLYRTLGRVTTDISSEKRFNDPGARTEILEDAKRLALLAHSISEEKTAAPDADPTIRLVAGLFQSEARQAYEALKHGNSDYARGILGGISGYCIACHTRNGTGPSFSALPMAPGAADLSALDQGRFFMATRQYDRAIASFEKSLSEGSTADPLDRERALRSGLAIAVRVKRDPDLALALLGKAEEAHGTPYYLKAYCASWRKSVIRWKEELPRRPTDADGLHAEAIRLTALAHDTQKYPADRAADIDYLRASSAIHDLLGAAPRGKLASEAFFMAGLSYEILRDLDLGDLHELYYESCVRDSPHTSLAGECFRKYQQSVIFGFTGSSGTFIPSDVRSKLSELELLARLPDGTETLR